MLANNPNAADYREPCAEFEILVAADLERCAAEALGEDSSVRLFVRYLV